MISFVDIRSGSPRFDTSPRLRFHLRYSAGDTRLSSRCCSCPRGFDRGFRLFLVIFIQLALALRRMDRSGIADSWKGCYC